MRFMGGDAVKEAPAGDGGEIDVDWEMIGA